MWLRTSQFFALLFSIQSAFIDSAVAAKTCRSIKPTKWQLQNRNTTLRIGIALFDGYEPLDVMGPLEIFASLSFYFPMKLSLIAHKLGPVNTIAPPHEMAPGEMMDLSFMIGYNISATHTYKNAPDLDVLLVPGGIGGTVLAQHEDWTVDNFIKARFNKVRYVLTVCTGSAFLARTGLLKGKKATTNKQSWAWVTSFGSGIKWVPSARWTEDGKIWTSSGVAAGMDMTARFVKYLYGEKEEVEDVLNLIEYAPHTDKNWDPFSIVHDVPGHNENGDLESCVRPAGF